MGSQQEKLGSGPLTTIASPPFANDKKANGKEMERSVVGYEEEEKVSNRVLSSSRKRKRKTHRNIFRYKPINAIEQRLKTKSITSFDELNKEKCTSGDNTSPIEKETCSNTQKQLRRIINEKAGRLSIVKLSANKFHKLNNDESNILKEEESSIEPIENCMPNIDNAFDSLENSFKEIEPITELEVNKPFKESNAPPKVLHIGSAINLDPKYSLPNTCSPKTEAPYCKQIEKALCVTKLQSNGGKQVNPRIKYHKHYGQLANQFRSLQTIPANIEVSQSQTAPPNGFTITNIVRHTLSQCDLREKVWLSGKGESKVSCVTRMSSLVKSSYKFYKPKRESEPLKLPAANPNTVGDKYKRGLSSKSSVSAVNNVRGSADSDSKGQRRSGNYCGLYY
eukprot:TRINITY_DN12074_c0_g1_i1.p1 TRINITY_DN12074_c0_g1~~TRINITY_DN12074_c0_g1_i1.p1  ORF type:complete len:394 (+),score=56.37 TRINITY_DN12074_c0_g1_i1:153-1334(+)